MQVVTAMTEVLARALGELTGALGEETGETPVGDETGTAGVLVLPGQLVTVAAQEVTVTQSVTMSVELGEAMPAAARPAKRATATAAKRILNRVN